MTRHVFRTKSNLGIEGKYTYIVTRLLAVGLYRNVPNLDKDSKEPHRSGIELHWWRIKDACYWGGERPDTAFKHRVALEW